MLQAKIINSVGLNNKDSDFQAGLTALINPGVVNGLELTSTEITAGKGFILATRTNVTPNEQWLVYINLTEADDITVGNNLKVWIELRQSNLNDITLNTRPFGDDIAEVKTGASFPSSNYIPIAETDGSGNITDLREFISLKNELTEASTFQLTELRGGNWKVLYTDSNGRGQELSLGTAGQVLTSAGTSNAPIWTSPSIDINALTEDTTGNMNNDFVQRWNGTNNRKIKINRYRATDAEATAGTSTTKFVTPKQAKDNYGGSYISTGSNAGTNATTISFTHGLGRIPKIVKLKTLGSGDIGGTNSPRPTSEGMYNGTSYACIAEANFNISSAIGSRNFTLSDRIGWIQSANAVVSTNIGTEITVTTLTDTTITLTNTVNNGSANSYTYLLYAE